MRKRLQIALAVLLVTIAGVITWQVSQASREREPVSVGQLKASKMLLEEPEDSDGSSGQIVGAFGIKLGQRFDPSYATFTNKSLETISIKGEVFVFYQPVYGFNPKNLAENFVGCVVVTPRSNIVCKIGASANFESAAPALAEYRKLVAVLQHQPGRASFISDKDGQTTTVRRDRRAVELRYSFSTNLSFLSISYTDDALNRQAKWEQVQLDKERPEMSNRFQEHVTGVGMVVSVVGQSIKIIHVLPQTPASKAGLVPGLVIREIDGTPTDGKLLKECVDMVRGAVGTKVRLELVDIENGRTNTVELTRERIL